MYLHIIYCNIISYFAENLVENIHYNVTNLDLVKNAEEYQKGAVQGDKIAQRKLGVCYELGIGVKRN